MNTLPTQPQAHRYGLAWFTQSRFLQESVASDFAAPPRRSEAFAEDLEDWGIATQRALRSGVAPARQAA